MDSLFSFFSLFSLSGALHDSAASCAQDAATCVYDQAVGLYGGCRAVRCQDFDTNPTMCALNSCTFSAADGVCSSKSSQQEDARCQLYPTASCPAPGAPGGTTSAHCRRTNQGTQVRVVCSPCRPFNRPSLSFRVVLECGLTTVTNLRKDSYPADVVSVAHRAPCSEADVVLEISQSGTNFFGSVLHSSKACVWVRYGRSLWRIVADAFRSVLWIGRKGTHKRQKKQKKQRGSVVFNLLICGACLLVVHTHANR